MPRPTAEAGPLGPAASRWLPWPRRSAGHRAAASAEPWRDKAAGSASVGSGCRVWWPQWSVEREVNARGSSGHLPKITFFFFLLRNT